MKKLFLMALLITVTAAALTGCKGGTKDDGKNSVTVGITQDLDSLDPHKAVAAGTKEVLYNLFEGLVKPDQAGNLVPAVAESYQISDDGQTYTFVLRKNVKFHNGNTVTAEDVVYSLKRCAGMLETSDPEVQVVAALSVISDITASNENGADIITITLNTPKTELIGYLTCSIIPKGYNDQKTNPVGTGPFRFVSYTPMNSFVMERFTDYYGDQANLDEVKFVISESTDAAFLKLQAGDIDIFPYLTVDQSNQLKDKYSIEIGDVNVIQEGKDVTILTVGAALYRAMDAAKELKEKYGMEAEVINLHSLVPLNYERIIESVKKTGRVVLVSDACQRGSFLNDVAANITELAFDYLDAPCVVVGARNWITPPFEFDGYFFPQPKWIIDAIHTRIVPLPGYVNETQPSDVEMIRRAKAGV